VYRVVGSRDHQPAILSRAVKDVRWVTDLARRERSPISNSTPRSDNPSGTLTMSFDPHLRRFKPSWLSPAIETHREETSKAPEVSPFASDEGLANDLLEREIDEAIEQIASERCCVCPLCGAIVANDGSVLG
jgi:hypothetical protein